MKNLKLELFSFKKKLNIDQEEISRIVEAHLDNNVTNNHSEKEIVKSLNEKLNIYTYDKDVKSLLENLNADLDTHQLMYELKHLYKVVESKNLGMIYRQPLNVILQTINLESDSDRMSKILNELAVYDWVPEIKVFVYNLTKNPEQKANLLSGGKAESIYTIVENVKEGYLSFVKDSWFLLTNESVDKVLLEDHIKDEDKLRTLRLLETSIQYASISEDRIDFRISENLTIGLSSKKKGVVFINEDELNKETTLENLFSSPIIPIVNKNFYPLIMEVSNNMDKFVELDVVKVVSNLSNPFLESFAFNYKDGIYVYRTDKRYGNSFFKYESATELIDEVKNELNFDLSYFFNDKLSKEVKVKRQLEDKEREIQLKLEDINFNIQKLEANMTVNENKILTDAHAKLVDYRKVTETELNKIKEDQYATAEKYRK